MSSKKRNLLHNSVFTTALSPQLLPEIPLSSWMLLEVRCLFERVLKLHISSSPTVPLHGSLFLLPWRFFGASVALACEVFLELGKQLECDNKGKKKIRSLKQKNRK